MLDDAFEATAEGRRLLEGSTLVGMHPDEATEQIVDAALKYGRPFAVLPCCVFANAFPHRAHAGTYRAFCDYLRAKSADIQARPRHARAIRAPSKPPTSQPPTSQPPTIAACAPQARRPWRQGAPTRHLAPPSTLRPRASRACAVCAGAQQDPLPTHSRTAPANGRAEAARGEPRGAPGEARPGGGPGESRIRRHTNRLAVRALANTARLD
eukprot:4094951-Prymnesium_polylepis.1